MDVLNLVPSSGQISCHRVTPFLIPSGVGNKPGQVNAVKADSVWGTRRCGSGPRGGTKDHEALDLFNSFQSYEWPVLLPHRLFLFVGL